MAFAWLLFMFLLGVGLRFLPSPSSTDAPLAESMLLAERLVLLARFGGAGDTASAPLEPDPQLLQAARFLEADQPSRIQVIEGRQVSEKEAAALPAGYRLLADYQARPTPEKQQALRKLARHAWQRLALCLGLLATLVGGALLLAFLGRTQPSREVQPMASLSPLLFLSVFMLWDVGNVYGVSLVVDGLGLREMLSPFALVVLVQLTVYGLMLGLLRWAGPTSWNLAFPFPTAWIGRGYFACYALVIGLNLAITALSGTAPVSSNPLLALFLQSPPWQVAILALLVVVVGPTFEEIIFRGWLLGGLRQGWGDRRALLASAALFAVIHGDPWATPALFLLGCVFGWVYLRSGSLYASLVLHAMWNATTFIFLLANLP